MKKNNFIEFFRFISAMTVFLFHAIRNLSDIQSVPFGNTTVQPLFKGWIGVEFFFILTGFFLARQSESDCHSHVRPGEASIRILRKKIKRVFPCHLYAFVICFVLTAALGRYSFYQIIRLFHRSIPNLFLLNLTGIHMTDVVRNEWFLSAMIMVIAIIYPVMSRFYDSVRSYFFLLPALIYGYLLVNYNQISDNLVWIGLGYKGVFRAAAGILLGCFAYELCGYFNRTDFSEAGTVLVHAAELIGFFSLLIYTTIRTTENEAVIVAYLAALSVAVSFSDKGFLKKIFRHRFFAFLGEMSFPIYMCESMGYKICKTLINKNLLRGNGQIILLDTFITLSFSVLFVLLSRLYRSRSKRVHAALAA